MHDLRPHADRTPPISGGNSVPLNEDVPGHVGPAFVASEGLDEPSSSSEVGRASPVSFGEQLDIPSSQQAREDFDSLISDMVDEISTC